MQLLKNYDICALLYFAHHRKKCIAFFNIISYNYFMILIIIYGGN